MNIHMAQMLFALGKIAHILRSVGLGKLLDWSKETIDTMFLRIGIPPLRVMVNELIVTGYLRHRSFLENLVSGKYENLTRKLFEEHLKPDMVVVDGGAHIGYYSLLAAKRMQDKGQIFAFEPDPYNFSALMANIRRNQYISIMPIPKALSNKRGYVTFYQSFGTIGSSLFFRNGISDRLIQVESTTLDSELEGRALVDILIKLDIEGSEPLALQGMGKVIEKSRSITLFMELNPKALRSAGYEPADLITALRGLGFSIHFIDEVNATLLPINEELLIHKGNLYCRYEK